MIEGAAKFLGPQFLAQAPGAQLVGINTIIHERVPILLPVTRQKAGLCEGFAKQFAPQPSAADLAAQEPRRPARLIARLQLLFRAAFGENAHAFMLDRTSPLFFIQLDNREADRCGSNVKPPNVLQMTPSREMFPPWIFFRLTMHCKF